jgi:hypothetical protein
MSDIPAMPYKLLWEERELVSVANLMRRDAEEFFAIAKCAQVPPHTKVYVGTGQSGVERSGAEQIEWAPPSWCRGNQSTRVISCPFSQSKHLPDSLPRVASLAPATMPNKG